MRGRRDPPFESPDVRPVHRAVFQIQQASAAKLGQQDSVQARPHAGLGPIPQPAPGRYPGAAHRLCGDITPCDTGPQHIHHTGECHSVGNAQGARQDRSSSGAYSGGAPPQAVCWCLARVGALVSAVSGQGMSNSRYLHVETRCAGQCLCSVRHPHSLHPCPSGVPTGAVRCCGGRHLRHSEGASAGWIA